MEGRYPNGIMLTLATCRDRAHLEEWLHWYAHIHTPDVTSAGVFVNMIRFRNTDPNHQGREYVNLSETDFDDPVEALEELKRRRSPFRSDDRQSPYTEVAPGGGPYRREGGEFQFVKNAPVRGVLMSASRPVDGVDSADFNRWFNDAHVPAVLGPGIFQSAYRYRSANSDGSGPSYLAIFETDREDVAAAAAENQAALAALGTDDGADDVREVLWWLTAERVFPLEGRA